MRRFRALIKKEITHMIRDPRNLEFHFYHAYLCSVVLLGYANTTDIKNVSTVISTRITVRQPDLLRLI